MPGLRRSADSSDRLERWPRAAAVAIASILLLACDRDLTAPRPYDLTARALHGTIPNGRVVVTPGSTPYVFFFTEGVNTPCYAPACGISLDERAPNGTGSAYFVPGQASPPLQLATSIANAVPFSSLGVLVYSTSRPVGTGSQGARLEIKASFDLDQQFSGDDGRIVFAPELNGGMPAGPGYVTFDVAHSGVVYTTAETVHRHDSLVASPCPRSHPCSTYDLVSKFPRSGFAPTGTDLFFTTGDTPQANVVRVDALSLGIGPNTATFDFEPAPDANDRTIVVNENTPNTSLIDQYGVPCGSPCAFVSGPGAPPHGPGSVRLSPGSDGRQTLLAFHGLASARFDHVNEFTYTSFSTAGTDAIRLEIALTYDATGAPADEGYLIFEPLKNGGGAPGQWTTFDVAHGLVYGTNARVRGPGGTTVDNPCVITSPCSAPSFVSHFPNSAFRSDGLILLGTPFSSPGFAGYVGNMTVGINGAGRSTWLFQSTTTTAPTVTAIALSPSVISLTAGSTQQLTVTTTLSDGSVQSVAASPATAYTTAGGTISATGIYTAPTTPGTYTITAVNAGRTATATINVVAALRTLFFEDFTTEPSSRHLDYALWTTETGNPSFLGQTQLANWLPSGNGSGNFNVTNAGAQLVLQTWNPTGLSMFADHAKTTQTFQPVGSQSVTYTARMQLTSLQPGIVWGIYFYNCIVVTDCDNHHDEIDIEILSNKLAGAPLQVELNRYANEGLGAGHGQLVPLPANFDPLAVHEWTIVWHLSRIDYLVDGMPVFSTTDHVPQGPMAATMIAWAPAANQWPDAYSGTLRPVSDPNQNHAYSAFVKSVTVSSTP